MNDLNQIYIGEIIKGRGIGGNRMNLLAAFFKKNGLSIYPGTLNICFSSPIHLDPEKAELTYDNRFYFWSIELNGLKCLAYRWNQCPLHIIEVVSNIRLRDAAQLSDGESVKVVIKKSKVKDINFLKWLVWAIIWKGREIFYYTNDTYPKILGKYDSLIYRLGLLLKSPNK